MTGGPLLLTGATGFVGMEVLARVLERTDRDVIALVRARDDAAAQARVDELLTTLVAPRLRSRGGRVRALAADLEAPRLGLSPVAREWIAGSISAVVHCAASISFTLPIEEARRINVQGTREVVKLAIDAQERGALERFVHVSTAYVAGDRDDLVNEHDGDVGQGFRNTYECTKLEAEGVVRDSGLPAAIVRPSIIVADALLELLRGPVRGGAFHLVSGERAPTNAQMATMAAAAFDAEPPRFVSSGQDTRAEQRAGALLPYFHVRCTFDARRAREQLGATTPPIEEYFPSLMRYARESRWGKRPSPRWYAGVTRRAA